MEYDLNKLPVCPSWQALPPRTRKEMSSKCSRRTKLLQGRLSIVRVSGAVPMNATDVSLPSAFVVAV
jgi:hypothetical protein